MHQAATAHIRTLCLRLVSTPATNQAGAAWQYLDDSRTITLLKMLSSQMFQVCFRVTNSLAAALSHRPKQLSQIRILTRMLDAAHAAPVLCAYTRAHHVPIQMVGFSATKITTI